jgi:surface carbohydrate biosynthesis protein
MKHYDVIIFIEHIVRELEAAVLMSKELTKKGLSSTIKSTFFDYYDVLQNFECDILIVPWCYNDKDYRFFSNIKCKHILNLHHEQISNVKENKLLPKNRAKNVYHLSWGQVFTDELIKCGVRDDLVFQCGSVRNDFYDEKFKKFSLSKNQLAQKYALNEDKKWILIAGNYPKIYFLDQANNLKKYKISETAVKSYKKTMEWIDKLCSEINTEYEVIYRPHPTESESEETIQLKNKYKNFSFIRDENIRDWIMNSSIVYAWRSTSAIDALIAGKKAFLIRPEFITDDYELPILKDMVKIDNYEMLLETVKSTTYDNQVRSEKLMKEIKKRYDQNKGGSYVKIADEIYNLFTSRTNETSVNNFHQYKFHDLGYLKLKVFVKHRLDFFVKFSKLKGFENFKHEKITKDHIDRIEKKLEELL